ncbi:DUF72 domain-containing protein [Cytophagaceae bacterium AH-315-L13]|nr:DUF72 domain-containing protein [Cytophagaceae bacterium AH-315-L13]
MKFGHLKDLDGLEFTLPEDDTRTTNLLKELKPTDKPEVYIGCPVWSEKGYVGKMYPKKTQPKNYLEEYCKQFNSIEVNAMRYGIPPRRTLENWKSCATKDFKFSFKFPDKIANVKDLNDKRVLHFVDEFLELVDFFGKSAGTSFLLLRPHFSLKRFKELESFLKNKPMDFPMALEIRDAKFFNDGSFCDLLNELNISLVITDAPGRRDVIHQILTTDTVFVRFVGGKLHPSDFTRIDEWVDRIAEWINEGVKTVYFFMHQPAPYKYLSADLSAYMIKGLNEKIPSLNLKPPKDYSKDDQRSLF